VDFVKSTIGGLPKRPQIVNPQDMSTNENPYLNIGERLEEVRRGFSELSQKSWAEKHGFNPTQWNNWRQGNRRIPIEAAEKLCDDYGLTLDWIYRGRRDGLSETASKVV
jgi:hypothetical protein